MAQPRVLVLRAPGTNCDAETSFAFETAGATVDLVHINRLLESPKQIDAYQIICFQGGFSYGDDVAAGQILGSQLQHHLVDELKTFKDSDRLMLGICNGFQVMMKAGLLLDRDDDGTLGTLTWNESKKYEDRWVHLSANNSKCVFLNDIESIYLPVAHAEGRFVCRSSDDLDSLDQANQLALRYTSADGSEDVPYPENPNGSMGHVAGVCDSTGRAFGLMPHPERFISPVQHPFWTRMPELPEVGQGQKIFDNAVAYFA